MIKISFSPVLLISLTLGFPLETFATSGPSMSRKAHPRTHSKLGPCRRNREELPNFYTNMILELEDRSEGRRRLEEVTPNSLIDDEQERKCEAHCRESDQPFFLCMKLCRSGVLI